MTYDFGDVDEERRRTMRAIGSEGTGPEEEAAEALDALGVGYEAQPRYGRYRPDFRLGDGSVLQVMGCFWHGCPCQRRMDEVETNEDYWTPKLRDNMARDRRRRRELLRDHGVPYVAWVWEHADVAAEVAWHCRRLGLVDGTAEAGAWGGVEKRGARECWPFEGRSRARAVYAAWFGDPGPRRVECPRGGCCANPAHLRLGAVDARTARSGGPKLDSGDVRDIRARYPGETQADIADDHGVSAALVSRIVNGEAWGWVE